MPSEMKKHCLYKCVNVSDESFDLHMKFDLDKGHITHVTIGDKM